MNASVSKGSTDEENESVEEVRHKNHEKVHQTISQKNMNCAVTTAALIYGAEFKALGGRTVSFLNSWWMSEFAKEWDKKCNSRKPRESPRRRLQKIKQLTVNSHSSAIHLRKRGLLPVKIQPFAELNYFRRKNSNELTNEAWRKWNSFFAVHFQLKISTSSQVTHQSRSSYQWMTVSLAQPTETRGTLRWDGYDRTGHKPAASWSLVYH